MSSDSEDDCYGNIAQKLQSLKNNYREDKIETTNLLIANLKEKSDNSWKKNVALSSENTVDSSQNSETAEEISLDTIIAKNSKKRVTRAKRKAIDTENILPTKRKRNQKNGASTSQSATNEAADTSISDVTLNTTEDNISNLNLSNPVNESITRGRTRGRARGRARQTTPRRARGRGLHSANSNNRTQSRARGRNRGRTSGWMEDMNNPSLYDFMAAIAASMSMSNPSSSPNGPVYSVGNTDEYPDYCDNQPLFNAPSNISKDVVVIDENEAELDENEELSVKVYWQSAEHVKFNIRKFQKLTEIFDHFAQRENISHDKLFFTYNDKILKSNDTPDSINYNIAKFIDGGIIHQSVSSILKKNDKEDGIKLKFQCQNVKKPFVTHIQPDEKMMIAMMKCSEHFEKPLDKLRFHFDGDLISGNSTPKDLDLEGGECIDVGVIS